MLRLAFRNLFRHRGRTSLTFLAIICGVAGIILVGGFVEDIYVQLREYTIHSRLGHLQLYAAGYYAKGRRAPYQFMIDDAAQLIEGLREQPHVKDIMRRVSFSGLMSNGRGDVPVIGEGVEPEKETRLGDHFHLLEGHQLTSDSPYGVLLGEGVAGSLRLKPGDFATLLLNTSGGALNSLEFEVLGIFRTFSKEYDDRAIRISLETAQELLDTTGVHALVFHLDESGATSYIAEQISRNLPATRYEVKTWEQLDDFYRKTVDFYRRQFAVLQLIVLGMVLFSVANSVNMTVYERVGEFGTLRALGHRGRDIVELLLVENALLGLLGAGLGVGLGVLLASAISQVGIPMPPPPNSNTGYTALIRIVPFQVAMAFAIGFFATFLAAAIAARRAARVPVVDALRENI